MIQSNSELISSIRHHMEQHPERVSPLDFDGQRYWIKRQEKMSMVGRIQKGDPLLALRQERDALAQLADKNLPVVQMAASGDAFIAVKDCGVSLDHVLQQKTTDIAECKMIFAAGGAALAVLHNNGVSHGRPSLRDICWLDGKITFIDFERYSKKRNSAKGHRNDLIMFVFNAHAVARGTNACIEAAFDAYRENDKFGIWRRAERWCRRMRWVQIFTNPISKRRNSREIQAISITFRTFRDYSDKPINKAT